MDPAGFAAPPPNKDEPPDVAEANGEGPAAELKFWPKMVEPPAVVLPPIVLPDMPVVPLGVEVPKVEFGFSPPGVKLNDPPEDMMLDL